MSDGLHSRATRVPVTDWFRTVRDGRSVVVYADRNGSGLDLFDSSRPVPAGTETVVTVSPVGAPHAAVLCYRIHGRPGQGTVGPLPPLPDVPPGATVKWREGVVRWVDLLAGTCAEAVWQSGRRLMCMSTETMFQLDEHPDGTVHMVELGGREPR